MSMIIDTPKPEITIKERLKSIVGGSIGNLVEWYDWYTYSAFTVYFVDSFFPKSDPTVKLLDAAAIFAGGFLMRPIGGWLFGSIADNVGRKKAMAISVMLMAVGSLMIALSPTYNQIGFWAPLILIIARLVQGLSVGGEYGTSATYLSEMATSNKRGFFASFQYVTLVGGQLVAIIIQLIMQNVMSSEKLHAWGWRIPFIIGAILSIIALYLREHISETEDFKKVKDAPKTNSVNSTNPAVKQLKGIALLLKYPKEVLTVIGLTLGGTIAFYTYSIYMQKFLINTVGISKEQSTLITFWTLLIFAILQPAFGILSDKIGRKPLLIWFGVMGTICTYPLMTTIAGMGNTKHLVNGQHNLLNIGILVLAGLMIISGYTSINAVVKAELFPAKIRAMGVGLPYAIANALFGGTAEMVALWFKKIGHENYFYIYVSACIFISLIIYATMKDTKHANKMSL